MALFLRSNSGRRSCQIRSTRVRARAISLTALASDASCLRRHLIALLLSRLLLEELDPRHGLLELGLARLLVLCSSAIFRIVLLLLDHLELSFEVLGVAPTRVQALLVEIHLRVAYKHSLLGWILLFSVRPGTPQRKLPAFTFLILLLIRFSSLAIVAGLGRGEATRLRVHRRLEWRLLILIHLPLDDIVLVALL